MRLGSLRVDGEAIHRDGYVIVPSSRRSCPHRWIDNHGPIDLERARRKPDEERFWSAAWRGTRWKQIERSGVRLRALDSVRPSRGNAASKHDHSLARRAGQTFLLAQEGLQPETSTFSEGWSVGKLDRGRFVPSKTKENPPTLGAGRLGSCPVRGTQTQSASF